MDLLTRDFEILNPSKDDPEQVNQTLMWQLEENDLIAILSETSTIISNLANSPIFAQSLSEKFDLLHLMQFIFRKYILETDFFNVDEAVSSSDADKLVKVAGLVEDLVFLTNNILVDELNERGHRPQQTVSDPLIVLNGID